MKKFFRFAIIFVLALLCVYLILRIPAVDRWLTGLIGSAGSAGSVEETVLHIDGSTEELEFPPLIYPRENRLYLAYQGEERDITPPDSDIRFTAKQYDITKSLRLRRNCYVSRDGRYVLFLLQMNEIPTLFYTNLQTAETGLIGARVDSFVLIESDSAEEAGAGPTVVYATGYTLANQIFLYRGGTSTLLRENVAAKYISAYRGLLMHTRDGGLYFYDIRENTEKQLASGVESVYFPGADRYPYDVVSETLTVYYKGSGGDYVYTQGASRKLEKSFYLTVPTCIYPTKKPEKYYYFTELENKLVCVDGDREYTVYHTIGDIYKIFAYDSESETFIAATPRRLYLLPCGAQGDEAQPISLMEFDGYYKKRRDMITRYMEVYTTDFSVFYIVRLTEGTWIWNRSNPESWMNKGSSYNYGLFRVRLRYDGPASAGEAVALNVPPTRGLYCDTVLKSGNVMLYTAFYDDGSVKSISVLSAEGNVLNRDILNSAADRRTYRQLRVLRGSEQCYLYAETKTGENLVYSMRYPDDGAVFPVLYQGIGVPYVSFGRLYYAAAPAPGQDTAYGRYDLILLPVESE